MKAYGIRYAPHHQPGRYWVICEFLDTAREIVKQFNLGKRRIDPVNVKMTQRSNTRVKPTPLTKRRASTRAKTK